MVLPTKPWNSWGWQAGLGAYGGGATWVGACLDYLGFGAGFGPFFSLSLFFFLSSRLPCPTFPSNSPHFGWISPDPPDFLFLPRCGHPPFLGLNS